MSAFPTNSAGADLISSTAPAALDAGGVDTPAAPPVPTQTLGEYVGEAESRESDPLPVLIASRIVTPRTDCMVWIGATDRGYGRVSISGKVQRVHRAVWEMQHGPIPEGLTIDHLCRVRMCCNTAHMELVTAGENSRRGAAARAKEALRVKAQTPRMTRKVPAPPRARTEAEAAAYLMDCLIESVGEHWVWVGYVDDRGYAILQLGEQRWRPHRLLWEFNNGPLGRTRLYRACEMDLCCNPDHMTFGKESPSRTVCVRGHDLTSPESVYEYPEHGIRTCRACRAIEAAERRRRNRAA